MRKITFEQIRSDLYEEITAQGLKVLVAPVAGSPTVYAGVYADSGAFRHEEAVGKTRIPLGIAHFLEHMLFHTVRGNAMTEFERLGAATNAYTTYSYTAFYFSTTEDYRPPLDLLLAMTTNLTFTDEEIDREREIILSELDQDLSDPSVILADEVKSNLFLDSPLKDSILGTARSIRDIHLSNLRKYFQNHFDLQQLTLIVVGDVDPEEIHQILESRKFTNHFRSEGQKAEDVKPLRYREEYGQVRRPYSTVAGAYDTPVLGLGIKFLPRMELYERYGDDLFAIYELLPQLLFGPASAFIARQEKLETTAGAEDNALDEGAEDAFLYISFATEKPDELEFELKNYLGNLHKKIKAQDLRLLKRCAAGRSVAEAAKPDELFFSLLEAYANHVAYPALAERVSSLSYKTVKAFLKDMETWPRASALLTKKEVQ